MALKLLCKVVFILIAYILKTDGKADIQLNDFSFAFYHIILVYEIVLRPISSPPLRP